jgi:hypothetical protein
MRWEWDRRTLKKWEKGTGSIFFLLYSNEAISLSRRRKVNITLVGPDFRSNKQSITGFAYDEEVLR